MSRSSLLTRVRQVASPRKMAKSRLERVQKVNKVSKSLFGPVIKSEFQRYAQLETAKYQLQASKRWNFDFVNESPIPQTKSRFNWQPTLLSDMPKFYHHTTHSGRVAPRPSGASAIIADRYQLFSECENICPLSQSVSAPSMIIQHSSAGNKRRPAIAGSSASVSLVASTACSSQRKITDYLKVRKRRMSTTSAVCLKKARAEF